jgi:NAD(P)H-dependent FMN reductase
LKNALDYAYAEWSNKPVAFVGYGGVGGARAVEQLRLNAIELQMAPIRSAVHILFSDYLAVIKDGKPLSEFDHLNQAARQMLDQLAWWTAALKAARENSLRQAA